MKKNFYGIMLGILILQKNIQKELEKLMKKLVKHITNPEKITQEYKKLISDLDYDGIECPVQEQIFASLRGKTIFASMCFVMKTSWFFQFTFQI